MKTILLWLFAWRYFADMPPNKAGKWVACALIRSPFRGEREVETREVIGLLNAYKVARWLALKADFRTPYAEGMIEIRWAIRPGRENL